MVAAGAAPRSTSRGRRRLPPPMSADRQPDRVASRRTAERRRAQRRRQIRRRRLSALLIVLGVLLLVFVSLNAFGGGGHAASPATAAAATSGASSGARSHRRGARVDRAEGEPRHADHDRRRGRHDDGLAPVRAPALERALPVLGDQAVSEGGRLDRRPGGHADRRRAVQVRRFLLVGVLCVQEPAELCVEPDRGRLQRRQPGRQPHPGLRRGRPHQHGGGAQERSPAVHRAAGPVRDPARGQGGGGGARIRAVCVVRGLAGPARRPGAGAASAPRGEPGDRLLPRRSAGGGRDPRRSRARVGVRRPTGRHPRARPHVRRRRRRHGDRYRARTCCAGSSSTGAR